MQTAAISAANKTYWNERVDVNLRSLGVEGSLGESPGRGLKSVRQDPRTARRKGSRPLVARPGQNRRGARLAGACL